MINRSTDCGAFINKIVVETVWPFFGWHPWINYDKDPMELMKQLDKIKDQPKQ